MTRVSVVASLVLVLVACTSGPAVPPDAPRVVEDPDTGVVSACLDPATPGAAYARCECTEDCATGYLCDPEESSRTPGGSCLRVCTTEADCSAGETCQMGTVGRCVPSCTSTADCGTPGRYCFQGRCTAWCQSDAECTSGNCNLPTGECLPAGEATTGAETDEPCLRDEDCRSRICLTDHCGTPCARSANGCPEGEFCYGLDSNVDFGQCFVICGTTADCTYAEAECLTVNDHGASARVCF